MNTVTALPPAIVAMVTRYGESERLSAYAFDDHDQVAYERHNRACRRRFAAVQRLTSALAAEVAQ